MLLLVTRPEPDGSEQAVALRAMGHEAVVEPLLRAEFLDGPDIDLEGVAALAATSRNGLRALARSSQALKAALGLPVYAVGAGTAALARELGFARVVSAEGDSADLAALLVKTGRLAGQALLHVCGSETAGDMAGRASAAGVDVRQAVLYRMVPAEQFTAETLVLLRQGSFDGVLLMSPRTAKTYVAMAVAAGILANVVAVRHFCLSEAVAAPLRSEGFERISVASRPNAQELLALVAGVAAQSAQKS